MNNRFCIWCGSTLGENTEFCYHCGKTQPQKENQLVDWLIRHTKDRLKDDAESTVIEAIKNFLKSHIYGTVVSLVLVTAVGVTVYAGPGNVAKATSEQFFSGETQQQPVIETGKQDNYSDAVLSQSDNAEIQSVVANFMNDIFYLGQKDADGNTIGTEEETYWYPGYDNVYQEVFADTRVMQTEGTAKTVSVYLPAYEPQNFVLETTKLMYDDGVVVAECYVEEFLDDAATGEHIGYRRTLHSLTKSEKGWRIFENRVEQLIEYNVINSNHVIDDWKNSHNSQGASTYEAETKNTESQNNANVVIDPASADMATLVNWLYNYVEALFAYDDVSRYHHVISYYTQFESSYYLAALPQQINGKTFHQVAIDSVVTDIAAMGYPPQIFEAADYRPVQMDVTVEITDNDGVNHITKNRLLLVMVDGEYRLGDDVKI